MDLFAGYFGFNETLKLKAISAKRAAFFSTTTKIKMLSRFHCRCSSSHKEEEKEEGHGRGTNFDFKRKICLLLIDYFTFLSPC